MLWQVLIASVYARSRELSELLGVLAPQLVDGVEVLVLRDDCDTPIGEKRTRLLQEAEAEYVCFVDDDDMVAPDYVPRILTALDERPDYVGFGLLFTVDGERQKRVVHDFRCGGWYEDGGAYWRDISHLNPIRREIATAAVFDGGFGEDRRWVDAVRASNLVRTYRYLGGRTLYWYRHSSADSLFSGGARRVGYVPAPEFKRVRFL